jgi:hypothetical protein
MRALSKIQLSGAPEHSVFNTDRLHDPTLKSAQRIAASTNLRVAKRRGVADTNLPRLPCCARRRNATPDLPR